jgi:uncharacterized protein DUF6491
MVGTVACIVVGACTEEASAPGGTAQSRGSQCFLASQVNGFSPISDTIVDVQAGASRYFRLTLHGFCPNTAFRNRVGLRTLGGGRWICRGLDAEIVVPDAMGGQRCLVRDVQPITRADWDAGRRH